MYRIGILATGRGHGSRGLLEAIHKGVHSGHIPAQIAFVLSNRAAGEFDVTDGFFDQVKAYGYPLITSSFRKFRSDAGGSSDWRSRYEHQVGNLIQPHQPDLCILAGFLLMVPELSRRYTMINLHPATPGGPIGMWQDVIWQLIAERATSSGNTVFHATEELDRGPTVSYGTFHLCSSAFVPLWQGIRGRTVVDLKMGEGEALPLFQLIRQHGAVRERPLVVETLKAFAEGRVIISNGQVTGPGGRPIAALDLTGEIERILAAQC